MANQPFSGSIMATVGIKQSTAVKTRKEGVNTHFKIAKKEVS